MRIRTVSDILKSQEPYTFNQKEKRDKERIRIFKNAHVRIYNLILCEKYQEAEEVSKRLTGICRAWNHEKLNRIFTNNSDY